MKNKSHMKNQKLKLFNAGVVGAWFLMAVSWCGAIAVFMLFVQFQSDSELPFDSDVLPTSSVSSFRGFML